MVFHVIPFYEVKSIWIGKSNGGKRLEYIDIKRAYSKCVENEIYPGFVNSSQESAAMFLRTSQRSMRIVHASLYRNKMEEFDAQVNEVRDEVSKVVILNDET